MIFVSTLVNSTLNHPPDIVLKPPSERELISRRVAAGKRVQRKRWLLRIGLAKIRACWKRLKLPVTPYITR